MLKGLEKPQPLPNKTFYLKEGGTNAMSQAAAGNFTSGQQGEFEVRAPPGTYCIIEAVKNGGFSADNYLEEKFGLDPSSSSYYTSKKCFNLDNSCLLQWWAGCDYVVTVGNQSITNVTINFNQPCPWNSPCVSWSCGLPE